MCALIGGGRGQLPPPHVWMYWTFEEISILVSYGNCMLSILENYAPSRKSQQGLKLLFKTLLEEGLILVSRDVFAVTVQKRQKWKTKKALQSFLSCSLASNHVFFFTQMFSPQTHKAAAWLISRAAKTNFLRFFFQFLQCSSISLWDCISNSKIRVISTKIAFAIE